MVGRKELEERPKLESSESASDADVFPDTEAKAPETGPGIEEAESPTSSVELPKLSRARCPGCSSCGRPSWRDWRGWRS